jgi:dihydrofolate reductase
MLEVTETIYLTRVHTSISNADAFFPIIDLDIWKLIKSEHHKKDDKNEFDYTFEVYQRRESI